MKLKCRVSEGTLREKFPNSTVREATLVLEAVAVKVVATFPVDSQLELDALPDVGDQVTVEFRVEGGDLDSLRGVARLIAEFYFPELLEGVV